MVNFPRLFIVSNRLPVSFSKKDDRTIMSQASGGLVSALTGYLDYSTGKGLNQFSERIWVGVPGCSQSVWSQSEVPESAFQYQPVFINNTIYNGYYNGMSNSVIWPLFHYFPSYAEYNPRFFSHYRKANEAFMDVLEKQLHPNDVVWIHDYHLLPLANKIRERFPEITIGFFLHIPFPSYEIFRMMPNQWQEEILHGMLGADLIGFHTIDYAGYFLKCVQHILGIGNERQSLKFRNRLVKVDVFPISIDHNKFRMSYNLREVAEKRQNYRDQFNGMKIIFSVDRLDYTKGVMCRLKGYEEFLKRYPEYMEKVVFIMSVVPSRDNIPKYQARKKEIDEFIGSFNARVGNITWKPVIYQYNHLEFDDLCALYTVCDLALITPLRDGMNLVCKEFVASRQDKRGVLLLSEMTGASRELTDAILINPNDTETMAHKIREGLEMPEEEQERRLKSMDIRVKNYDVNSWAEDYLQQLFKVKKVQKEYEFLFLNNSAKIMLVEKYRAARRRLILLDYDGTLVPFSSLPHLSQPDKKVLDVLRNLASDPANSVYVISGRDSNTLENWLGNLPVNLIAEHGAKVKNNGVWETNMLLPADDHWKDPVRTIMESYVKRCANSFVEEKDFSVVWHYRLANPEQARIRSMELYSELLEINQQLNVQVMQGNKIIEVRVNGMDKGFITRRLLSEGDYDFILACGDDNTDEDMFRVLTDIPGAYTLKIGDNASYANYNLYTPQMNLSLLELLANSTYVEGVRG